MKVVLKADEVIGKVVAYALDHDTSDDDLVDIVGELLEEKLAKIGWTEEKIGMAFFKDDLTNQIKRQIPKIKRRIQKITKRGYFIFKVSGSR